MYAKAKKAFEEYQYWPQEKVDEMVLAVGWELQKKETAEELARLGRREVGDRRLRGQGAQDRHEGARDALRPDRGVKTCGLVEEDKAKGIRKYAKPIGVIANVVPCTNPESTVCCIALSTLKTRNAIICSPHPRTELATYPDGGAHPRRRWRRSAPRWTCVQCIRHTSNEKTAGADGATATIAVATGGAALVKVVYAAGVRRRPSAPGTSSPSSTRRSRTFRGSPSGSGSPRRPTTPPPARRRTRSRSRSAIFDKMIAALKAEGGYLCSTEERETLRKTMWPDGHTLNRDIVAHNRHVHRRPGRPEGARRTRSSHGHGREDRPRGPVLRREALPGPDRLEVDGLRRDAGPDGEDPRSSPAKGHSVNDPDGARRADG